MIVAPTEPAKLRAGNECSMLPERYGCDVAWIASARMFGVQRKEFADLVASVGDGRLGVQVHQMQDLIAAGGVACLLVEGVGSWNTDGEWLGRGRGLSVSQYRGILWTVQAQGVQVGVTRDLDDTIRWLADYEAWTRKTKHGSLSKREGVRGEWGTATNQDFQRHLLLGLPGVGVELADRIIAKFGGVPWVWGVGMEELMEVEGVGKKKASRMMEAFGRE